MSTVQTQASRYPATPRYQTLVAGYDGTYALVRAATRVGSINRHSPQV